MDLTIEIKSIYGEEKIYPACAKSQAFCDLLGQKTLTRSNINKIKAMGYTFSCKAQSL